MVKGGENRECRSQRKHVQNCKIEDDYKSRDGCDYIYFM